MILPGKHIKQDRALIAVGGDILSVLDAPMSVSAVWKRVQVVRATREGASPLPFDWFILALTLLYAISAINHDGDRISPARGQS
jgi:hypothetical protein